MRAWRLRGALAAVAFSVLAVGLWPLEARQDAPPRPAGGAAAVDFNRQIRPLLSDRCFRCHGPDASKRKAKLRLDTREGLFKALDEGMAVVTPKDPARSELIRRTGLAPEDEDVMPPADAHLALTEAEKSLLTQWVVEGAAYRGHWSWEPIGMPVVPTTTTSARTPIDGFVRTRLAVEGLAPAPPAPAEVLIRRLSLNLTGLPPTPAEIDAFVADESPDSYARAVERLLASPAYGERMAEQWLDLARYADTYGYQADVARDMSPYRDWVIAAFNRNLPYDQFLTWQLAGDLLPNATREQRMATAFNRLHRQTNEGGSIEEEFRTEYVADRVNTFGTAMLGLTLECARCHDHKFDAITQRDYFSLFAFFNSIDESGLYSHFTNATPSPSLLLWPSHAGDRARRPCRRAKQQPRRRSRGLAQRPSPHFRPGGRRPRWLCREPVAHLPLDVVDWPARRRTWHARKLRRCRTRRSSWTMPAPAAARHCASAATTPSCSRGCVRSRRTDAFSMAVRLKPTERQPRAVVVHQSRAWTDAGSRGFELTLEDGRPFFGLIHFWPGNAIAIRAREPLPLGRWSSVVVTYDGSSRAAGIGLYVDGVAVAVDVVRDHLFKDILYDKAGRRLAGRSRRR